MTFLYELKSANNRHLLSGFLGSIRCVFHCVKSVRIRSFSATYFPEFGKLERWSFFEKMVESFIAESSLLFSTVLNYSSNNFENKILQVFTLTHRLAIINLSQNRRPDS